MITLNKKAKRGRPEKYPFSELSVGESFTVHCWGNELRTWLNLTALACKRQRETHQKLSFSVRKTGKNQVTVFRMKNNY